MISGLFWLVAANVAAAWGALALIERSRTGKPDVDTLLCLLLRIGLISAAVLVAGLTRTLTPQGIGVPSLILLVCLIGLEVRRRRFRMPRFQLPRTTVLLCGATALLLLRFLVQAWVFTPHVGDAVNYYLPKVAEWVQRGGFDREMGTHPYVTYPAGFELVETWWVVFLHHDVLIEMAGAEFLAIAFSATYVLGKRLGLSPNGAIVAALLYVLTPGFYFSALSCLNDAPAAALVVATAAVVAGGAPLAWAVFAAGLGIGIKPTYAYAIPGLAVLGWMLRQEVRATPGRSAWWDRGPAAAALLLGGSWYFRNWIWYGNPIYPLGSSQSVPGISAPQVGPRISSLWDNVSDLINWRIYDAHAYGPLVDHSAGWGVALFACGAIALLDSIRDARAWRILSVSFFVSLGSILLFSIHDPWCLKYVFFFPALPCLAMAREAQVCRPVVIVILAGAAYLFLGTFVSFDLSLGEFRRLAGQSWVERSAAARFHLEVPKEILELGYFGTRLQGHGDTYLLYGPNMSRRIHFLRAKDGDELRHLIRLAGVRRVYASPTLPSELRVLKECVRFGVLRPLQDGFFSVEE